AAKHAEQLGDAEMVQQSRLRADHVAYGDDWEVETKRAACGRVGRARPGRAHAAAEDIGAQHEIAVGVDRLARADHGLPPARLAGDRMEVCNMLVASQRMADEHEVRLGGIKLAISLIGDRKLRELAPAVERQLLVEMNDMA